MIPSDGEVWNTPKMRSWISRGRITAQGDTAWSCEVGEAWQERNREGLGEHSQSREHKEVLAGNTRNHS